MNNKLIFLIVVLALLFGLIFIINKGRNAREKIRIEEKKYTERQQFVKDSIQNIQAINSETKSVNDGKVGYNKGGGSNTSPSEDFSSYINTSITNSSGTTNIAVTIVDENGQLSSSISSSIANIYDQTGNFGDTGLIRSSFIKKSSFQELSEGNSEIIEKLKLSKYADYVAIGKISYSYRKGTLVDGTIICTVKLIMNIISANHKSLVKSFTCTSNGNGTTEDQAKEIAIEKLLSDYISEYSSI